MHPKILVIDDRPDDAEVVRMVLRDRGYAVDYAQGSEAGLVLLERDEYATVLTEARLKGVSGLELCSRVTTSRPDVPVVVMTCANLLEAPVSAIRAGAFDFVAKPVVVEELSATIERAVLHAEQCRVALRVSRVADPSRPIPGIVGSSPSMQALTTLIRRVADGDATVLIRGESGTGKDLVARAIHASSPRAEQPFVGVNCAAIPANLLESELFGHVRGAFTSAHRDRSGLFSRAGGGTLFLDEIGEMPLPVQSKLLRVLQERVARPVGDDQERPFDARLVCATNRDLEAEVAAGHFRQDLFYRINVVAIDVPPLRARAEDILPLAEYFLGAIASRTGKAVTGLAPDAARRLLDYDWPGNVRELENCIERAVALARGSHIAGDDLPERIRLHVPQRISGPADAAAPLTTLAEMEDRYIRQVLTAASGNKTLAARILGISRRSLYRRLADGSGAGSASASTPATAAGGASANRA